MTGSSDLGEPVSWWPAPAKLNLFLHVTGRYADGYHALQTIFQLIDRCDRIGLAVREDGCIERRAGMAEVEPARDLAVRAARLLQESTGATLGANIYVDKRIPAGGGLGGGSSDAATVLLALNTLWDTRIALPELARLGLALGADVPVFVAGHSAWGEGRGEQLWPLTLPPRWYLVVHPRVAVSTADVFQAPELTRNSPLITIRAFSADCVGNVCEPVVRARYPAVAEALDWLSREARTSAQLTGTGSCIFASFEREQDAQMIAARVPERWSGFVARGLNHSPLHARL
ncbi:MAG TPA: 4-(cytidine 5'-diphospho)-2-C-methyl-D-erythritol kinase [Steroidobacteraceae bacterium]|jgi:4-diphosphocytidyl-2-C-methyl-D-erythritol kinase|nr:4-(cytidine 5'-diphospho)-2-C-methyl-D-erythritol kinase [Steroidobacteraceae bacterium]